MLSMFQNLLLVGVWDGLDECEISRPEILSQSAPGVSISQYVNMFSKSKCLGSTQVVVLATLQSENTTPYQSSLLFNTFNRKIA